MQNGGAKMQTFQNVFKFIYLFIYLFIYFFHTDTLYFIFTRDKQTDTKHCTWMTTTKATMIAITKHETQLKSRFFLGVVHFTPDNQTGKTCGSVSGLKSMKLNKPQISSSPALGSVSIFSLFSTSGCLSGKKVK